MDNIIDVSEFATHLVYRNSRQGDGKNTAIEFRNKYLSKLDNVEVWNTDDHIVTLNFSNVIVMSPGFANEAFAYFLKYPNATKRRIMRKIWFKNLSRVQTQILDEELST